jgi:hypothetical protein
MTSWRTYADPPASDPSLSRAERKGRARALRDELPFAQALSTAGTGYVVWMCADALDAVAGPTGTALDAVHVDDALPGPWETDLIDLALHQGMGGRAAESMAEGYQQGLAAVAAEPLHAAQAEALRRSRRLAAGVTAEAAQSTTTAVRRLVSSGARLRRDRAEAIGDLGSEMAQYRESLPEHDARLLAQYRVADAVAGEGGRLLVLLARGTDGDDVLLLEATATHPSTRESSFGAWRDGSDVQRVLLAREAVPLVPAEFAGWSTSADGAVARVWSRARLAVEVPDLGGRRARARRLGTVLGLLHAATGDAASLSGYVGHSRKFPLAVRDAVLSSGDR